MQAKRSTNHHTQVIDLASDDEDGPGKMENVPFKGVKLALTGIRDKVIA